MCLPSGSLKSPPAHWMMFPAPRRETWAEVHLRDSRTTGARVSSSVVQGRPAASARDPWVRRFWPGLTPSRTMDRCSSSVIWLGSYNGTGTQAHTVVVNSASLNTHTHTHTAAPQRAGTAVYTTHRRVVRPRQDIAVGSHRGRRLVLREGGEVAAVHVPHRLRRRSATRPWHASVARCTSTSATNALGRGASTTRGGLDAVRLVAAGVGGVLLARLCGEVLLEGTHELLEGCTAVGLVLH